MNTLTYLLQSGACAALLWITYYVLLRGTSRFTFNRAYLLLAMLCSAAIPLLNLPLLPAEGGSVTAFSMPGFKAAAVGAAVAAEGVVEVPVAEVGISSYITPALLTLYVAGAVLFALRFALALYRIRKTVAAPNGGEYTAFTFFRKIYVKGEGLSAEEYRKVMLHEQVHARQLHSIDLVLSEVFIALQWFNPFAWQIKKSLAEVHEYLADANVISQGVDQQEYKELLLRQVLGACPQCASGFNRSLTKSRLLMMARRGRSKLMALRLACCTLMLAALVLAFGCGHKRKQDAAATYSGGNSLTNIYDLMVINHEIPYIIYTMQSGQKGSMMFTGKADVEHFKEKLAKTGEEEIAVIALHHKTSTGFKVDLACEVLRLAAKSGSDSMAIVVLVKDWKKYATYLADLKANDVTSFFKTRPLVLTEESMPKAEEKQQQGDKFQPFTHVFIMRSGEEIKLVVNSKEDYEEYWKKSQAINRDSIANISVSLGGIKNEEALNRVEEAISKLGEAVRQAMHNKPISQAHEVDATEKMLAAAAKKKVQE